MSSAFSITTISGKRCTAIPKTSTAAGGAAAAASTSVVPIVASTSISTSASTSAAAAAAAIQSSSSMGAATEVPEPTTESVDIEATPQNSPEITSDTTTAQETPAPVSTTLQDQTTSAVPVIINSAADPAAIETTTAEPVTAETESQTATTVPGIPSTVIVPVSVSSHLEGSSTQTTSTPAILSTSTPPSIPVAQSETSPPNISSDPSNIGGALSMSIFSISSPTSTSSNPIESLGAIKISSASKVNAGTVVGGVFGGIAVVSILAYLLWWWRKKRRNSHGSSLAPLTPPFRGLKDGFYEIDNASIGPSRRRVKWRARIEYGARCTGAELRALGVAFKARVARRTSTLGVNMNRGNSQFLQQVPQHSRNPSSVMTATITRPTITKRIQNWWGNLNINGLSNLRFERAARKPQMPKPNSDKVNEMTEPGPGVDFSSLLAMKPEQLQGAADQRRQSLYQLGHDSRRPLDKDPFMDSVTSSAQTDLSKSNASVQTKDSDGAIVNPFADPSPASLKLPPPSASRRTLSSLPRSTQLHTIIESQPALSIRESRHPSTYYDSLDSSRSTLLSVDLRSKKGRSDPFDLERPELWQPTVPQGPSNSRVLQAGLESLSVLEALTLQASVSSAPLTTPSAEGNLGPHLDPQRGAPNASGDVSAIDRRVLSEIGTYSSAYSSGVGLSEWGDPGPDVGGRRSWEKLMAEGRVESLQSDINGVGKAF